MTPARRQPSRRSRDGCLPGSPAAPAGGRGPSPARRAGGGGRSAGRGARAGARVLGVLLIAALLLPAARASGPPDDEGCLSCHAGTEDMHPWLPLTCTECHGGDGRAMTEDGAHVRPRGGWPKDERVMHRGFDPPAVRFRNPSDLRVVDQTCGPCHAEAAAHLPLSLHGTTAGHLNDGLYENGVNPTREAVYGIFPVEDDDVRSPHGLGSLRGIEALRVATRDPDLGDHFADLPRKSCMQCHLYSDGFAVTGRLGQDGLYRSSGCAACHLPYGQDGLSRSADPTIDPFEPGHPLRHQLVAAPPTPVCTTCHVGDASIGNGFRGLAQLYPEMPAGPDIPGTTDRLIANQFFLEDEQRLPPDLHHAAGMHCVDCHGALDVMGDGDLYGAMEHGVAIECTSCHGTPEAYATLEDGRGDGLDHLRRMGDYVVLRSKVDGKAHRVKQARDVVTPGHPDHNPRAALAMTGDHARLECYACHSGWSTNFFGFHFDRNEQFTQLDLITGHDTRGAVSTQERVFATLRQFVLGLNSEGRIAPYMVGFSTMGTVHDRDGGLALDQALPETAAGLSGMTMIHHQTHTTQPAARSCVECHRSPATWGLGTGGATGGSYSLARGLVVTVGERGLETLLLDRESPGESRYLARLPLGGASRVVLDSDPVDGRARTAFVLLSAAGVALVDVSNPAFPQVGAFVAAGDARDLALAGDYLLIANGEGGLRVVDVSDRRAPELVCDLQTREARGLSVQWPRVYVADGPGGLVVVDLAVPTRPRIAGQVRCSPRDPSRPDDASAVATLFQYGRPDGPRARTPARLLAVVANGGEGLSVLDVTEPLAMRRLSAVADAYGNGAAAIDVTLAGRYELGDTTGITPTVERDVAYVTNRQGAGGSVVLLDLTDPVAPVFLERRRQGLDVPGGAALLRSFNPPSLDHRLAVAHEGGLLLLDVTDSEAPVALANLTALAPLSGVAVEAFAFDRMVSETGEQLKDISHEGARYLSTAEIHRVLTVPADVLGRAVDPGRERADLTAAYGDAVLPGGLVENSLPRQERGDSEDFSAEDRLRYGFTIGPTEPLARMVRHVDPRDHDPNGDGLSRAELERLVFAVLDANGDGALDLLEWPRHPHADPRPLDRNGDEVVSRSEMDLGEEVFRFFDVDGDGLVVLTEWPWELVDDAAPVLMYTDPRSLRDVLERPGFDEREPQIYALLAGGLLVKPRDVEDQRLQQLVDRARGQPLSDLANQGAVGDALLRWDIDRDGHVSAAEYAPLEGPARRCDVDGDGDLDEDDRAAPFAWQDRGRRR